MFFIAEAEKTCNSGFLYCWQIFFARLFSITLAPAILVSAVGRHRDGHLHADQAGPDGSEHRRQDQQSSQRHRDTRGTIPSTNRVFFVPGAHGSMSRSMFSPIFNNFLPTKLALILKSKVVIRVLQKLAVFR
jgi:hypothetical protein